MINLTKIVKEGFEGQDQRDNNREALLEDDIVLTQVKLKVLKGSMTWITTSQTDNPSLPRTESNVTSEGQIITLTSQSPFLVVDIVAFIRRIKVNITKSNTASSESFGQVQAIKEDQHFIRVILEKGMVRGINRSLKLPLDKKNPELIQAFGNYVEIDPSKPLSEPLQNKVKIGVAVEGALGPRCTTATLTNKEKEYKGHFVGKVIMYGKGLACGLERQVGDVIDVLQRARPGRTDLAALTIISYKEENAVEFTIEGDLECKWDFEQTVEWK